MQETEGQLRIDLAAAYRLIALYGWDDLIFTHLSVRIPGPEHHFLINPYGMTFDEITASSLVLHQVRFGGFRASRMTQNKAQRAGNGSPFPSAATPYWVIRDAPFGRAVKRPPAVLRLLARTGPLPARRALRSTASRLAEPIKPNLMEY